jgi:hypothetical protein
MKVEDINSGTLLKVDKHVMLLDERREQLQIACPGDVLIFLNDFHDDLWEGAQVLTRNGMVYLMWMHNMQQGCNSKVSVI